MFILTRKKKQLMAMESESDNTSAWNAPDKYTPLEKSHLFFGVGVFFVQLPVDLYISPSCCLNPFNQHIYSVAPEKGPHSAGVHHYSAAEGTQIVYCSRVASTFITQSGFDRG